MKPHMYPPAFAKRNEEKITEFIPRMGQHSKRESAEYLQSIRSRPCLAPPPPPPNWTTVRHPHQKAHNKEETGERVPNTARVSTGVGYKIEAKRAGIQPHQEWDRYSRRSVLPNTKSLVGGAVKSFYQDCFAKEHIWTQEFAGLVANGSVFKGNKGKYVTFVTLGVDNGQYIDVTIKVWIPTAM